MQCHLDERISLYALAQATGAAGPDSVTDTGPVSASDLSRIPVRQRRQLVWGLLPTGLVFVFGGLIALIEAHSVAFVVLALGVAFVGSLVLGIGLGVRRSISIDEHDAAVDEAIREATGPCGNECSDSCATDDCAVKSLPRL
jgi:hypothetical protein